MSARIRQLDRPDTAEPVLTHAVRPSFFFFTADNGRALT